MRTVTLLADRGGSTKGTDVELDDGSAQFLIDVGDAVAAGEDAPEVLGTRTVDEVIHPTLEAGPGDEDVEPLDLPTSSGEPVKDVDSEERDPVVPDALPMAPDPNVADPRQGHVEGVGGEYDPAKHTVADVNGYLDEQREAGNEDEVARVLQLEAEGRGRAGILDA